MHNPFPNPDNAGSYATAIVIVRRPRAANPGDPKDP